MRPRKAVNQINVVPYIDVMLVLLVIFMVTAPLITPGEIELPSVGQKPRVPQSPLHVVIEKNKTFSLRDERGGGNARASSREQLASLVQQKLQSRPDQPVVIEADRTVPYGDVVAILDLLQQTTGTGKVGLLVQPPQK